LIHMFKQKSIICILMVLLLCILFIPACRSTSTDDESKLLVSHTQGIVNRTIKIERGWYCSYEFIVEPHSMKNSVLAGLITVSGEFENIIVQVMDNYSKDDWLRGRNVKMVFNSGKMTRIDLNVPIPNYGVYFIFLNNELSYVDLTEVNANISLTWAESEKNPVKFSPVPDQSKHVIYGNRGSSIIKGFFD
jgi:hypothetical protein